LGRLNQKIENNKEASNRLKEKVIRSNLSLETTNDMIGMASSWEERPRPQKCDEKDDPQVRVTALLTCSLNQKQKNFGHEDIIIS